MITEYHQGDAVKITKDEGCDVPDWALGKTGVIIDAMPKLNTYVVRVDGQQVEVAWYHIEKA